MIPIVRLTASGPADCADGSYPSCSIALRTFSLVSRLMDGWFLQTLDAVDGDTPASAATSFNVTDMQLPAFLFECYTYYKTFL